MIRFELDKPPSTNALFATDWKTKRRFKSKEYERWLASADIHLMLARVKPIIGPVNVTITIEDTGRIERLVPGPYLELFARTTRPGWTSWGNQVGKFGQAAE